MSMAVAEQGAARQARSRLLSLTTRRLLGELGLYRRSLLLILLLVLLGAGAQAAGPWLIGRAIDRYILRRDRTGLALSMLALLATYVIGSLATRGQVYRVGRVGQSVIASLRARLLARLQRLPLSFFDRQPVGDLVSRVANDVDTLNQLLSQGLTQLLGSLFSLAGIIVVMVVLNPRLALVSFTILPVMVAVTVYFGGRSRIAFRTTRQTVGSVTADVQEEIIGVREAQRTSLASARATRPIATPTYRRWRSPQPSRRRSTC